MNINNNLPDLISESLSHSYWTQVDTYFKELKINDYSAQLTWLADNNPEYILGYSKWISREFTQYKIDTNFGYYNILGDCIKNILTVIELENRQYFLHIEKSVSKLLGDNQLKNDYIIKTIERLLLSYYRDKNATALEEINTFFSVSINFPNIDKLLEEDELSEVIECFENDYEKVENIFYSLEYYIPLMDKHELIRAKTFIIKSFSGNYDVLAFDNMKVGDVLDKNRLMRLISDSL